MSEPASTQFQPRESALRSYLQLAAYGIPCLFFVVFADLVLIPRMLKIWSEVGGKEPEANWIFDLCSIFVVYFQFFAGAAAALFVILEKTWPAWQRLRSPVLRITAWLLNFAVMLGMTWMAVAALLVAPKAVAMHRQKLEPNGGSKAPP
ncbi:MAG TPA: hypothetical protein PK490_04300 [Prosthecobacter sp.]|nr:hypothetical protein [Prosthecobacter sp.]HRK13484.1 hypothetical protein [Prosthecobacter sp.]